MLKKEARAITGGLSDPGKMPGYAYSLPAQACITGSKLVKIPGTVCYGCYALKGNYKRFPAVRLALARRLQALPHPRWVDAMVTLISGEEVFRWHDSGDLQSVQHLKNIFEVCNATPETSHWLPTREAKFLKLMDPEVLPKNLIIRMSSHMIDQKPVTFWPWTSTVSTGSFTCPASKQGNECKSCRNCWDRSIANVIYPKH